jgi:hypothetical protein
MDDGCRYLTSHPRTFVVVVVYGIFWFSYELHRRLLEPIGNIPPAEADHAGISGHGGIT